MGRYDDRLDPAEFQDDPPVGVGPAHDPETFEGWIYIPERLFARIRLIAAAYQLHVLPTIDQDDRNVLRPEQVGTLLDEIEFIGGLVDDAALAAELERLRDVAQVVNRRPRPAELVIDGG